MKKIAKMLALLFSMMFAENTLGYCFRVYNYGGGPKILDAWIDYLPASGCADIHIWPTDQFKREECKSGWCADKCFKNHLTLKIEGHGTHDFYVQDGCADVAVESYKDGIAITTDNSSCWGPCSSSWFNFDGSKQSGRDAPHKP